ncbi:MAG: tRNA epoxyqueuosine(34) reductase QueG [Muribaculaceae bacterium]|nr:tRNA epoxyqueuosine(34) reductase QueG [Muribaculaceae bacterium]
MAAMQTDILADNIRTMIHEAGGVAVGFAPLREVPSDIFDRYLSWLDAGCNASMDYLARNIDIRRNPALLLGDGSDRRPGGTVISVAFPYFAGNPYREGRLRIARYALGDDYHERLRKRLQPVARHITAETGHQARICVDTAPILERYWALEAGVGFIGRNRQLIIPDKGGCFFLAEIVTRAVLPPDKPCTLTCGECDRCLRACPGHALSHDRLDARACHSYLTIEHRGDLPDGVYLRRGALYGCDVCLEVCPLCREAEPAEPLPEFNPRDTLLDLTPERVKSLTPDEYALLFRRSPVKRAKLAGLLRNLRYLP